MALSAAFLVRFVVDVLRLGTRLADCSSVWVCILTPELFAFI